MGDLDGNFSLPAGEVNRSTWWQHKGTDVPASVVRPETVECVRGLLAKVGKQEESLDGGELLV